MKFLFKFVFLIGILPSMILYSHYVSAKGHIQVVPKTQIQKNIDINKASVEELNALKGIGLKRAKAIVDYREKNGHFKSIDDLSHVKGFSQKSVKRLIAKNKGQLIAH